MNGFRPLTVPLLMVAIATPMAVVSACDAPGPATSTQCFTGEVKCASACVVVSVDRNNCGACGNACAAGQVCSAGHCGGTCPQGAQACPGDGGDLYCASVETDNANCGACGSRCPPLNVCVSSKCTSTCASGQVMCPMDGGPSYCAKLDTDNANCGACGNVCGALEECVSGKCEAACLVSQTKCPPGGPQPDGAPARPYCADTKNDNLNCGGCGNSCPLNKPLCSVGMCVETG